MTNYLALNAGGLNYVVEYTPPTGLAVTGVSPDFTTITGSGFGTHALDIEWIGADIEAGTVGQDFAKTGWVNNSQWADHAYSTDQYHSGSKALKVVVNDESNGVLYYALPNPVLPGEKFFMSWWTRWEGTEAGQWKMLRIEGQAVVVGGDPQIVMFNWFGAGGQVIFNYGYPQQQVFYPSSFFPRAGSWYRCEISLTASSTGNTDGTATFRTNVPGNAFVTLSTPNVMTHVDAGEQYGYIVFQNYMGNSSNGGTIYTDDVYIQKGTHARVEMGDNATFTNCTHIETQVPTAWSDTSITVTPNFGSFGAGSSVYLFVVDSTGTPSAGYGPIVTPA
jgi:hypothetical protein